MYNKTKIKTSKLKGVQSYIAESIEKKVQRILNNKEPIKDGAPIVYQERKDGVQPAYNIRSDRFDIAVEGMDKVTRSKLASRDSKAKVVDINKKDEPKTAEGEGKA